MMVRIVFVPISSAFATWSSTCVTDNRGTPLRHSHFKYSCDLKITSRDNYAVEGTSSFRRVYAKLRHCITMLDESLEYNSKGQHQQTDTKINRAPVHCDCSSKMAKEYWRRGSGGLNQCYKIKICKKVKKNVNLALLAWVHFYIHK